MDILFVVPYVPSLIRVRPFNLIRHLEARGHRLTLLTLWENEEELEMVDQLREYCHAVTALHLPRWRAYWNSLAAIPTHIPLQAAYSRLPDLDQHIAKTADECNTDGRFDVTHVEHLRAARYGLLLKSFGSSYCSTTPVVWDSVDCISHLFRQAAVQSESAMGRLMARFELKRTISFERYLLQKFNHVLVTSPRDRAEILALSSSGEHLAPVSVIPNGVDLDYFKPNGSAEKKPVSMVVSGKLSYHANITMVLHLVKNIMPGVWARRPDVKLYVVGKDPPKEIVRLAKNPAIRVTGTVPDIRPFLQSATLAVAPIAYGAGIQNKVLEAMACGCPVVASPQAVSALHVKPGVDLLVADDPADFAEAIIRLLDVPELRKSIIRHGRHYVERYHCWDLIVGQLEEVYEQVIRDKMDQQKH